MVSDTRRYFLDLTYIVFNDQLLGDILEVTLAHPFESIPDVLLDEFFHFRDYFSIFDPVLGRIPISSGFREQWRGNTQVWPRV